MPYLKIINHPLHIEWCINRPERMNGLGTNLAMELGLALKGLETTIAGKAALVLTAKPIVKGDKRTWIAGGDLKELAQVATPEAIALYAGTFSTVLRELARLPIPVITTIDGAAIGGGAELALAGDIRLATKDSSLEFKQLKVGLPTGYGGCRRLVSLVGLSLAQEMLLGCRTITAEQCVSLGLIHQVCEDETTLKGSMERWVTHFASLSPEAIAAQKTMLWHTMESHPGAGAAAELAAFQGAWGNPSHHSFLARFLGSSQTKTKL